MPFRSPRRRETHLRGEAGSLFLQQKVQAPASSAMRARTPEVAQDGGVVAACVFEGVGEDR